MHNVCKPAARRDDAACLFVCTMILHLMMKQDEKKAPVLKSTHRALYYLLTLALNMLLFWLYFHN